MNNKDKINSAVVLAQAADIGSKIVSEITLGVIGVNPVKEGKLVDPTIIVEAIISKFHSKLLKKKGK